MRTSVEFGGLDGVGEDGYEDDGGGYRNAGREPGDLLKAGTGPWHSG
jgi:hypothetical protein